MCIESIAHMANFKVSNYRNTCTQKSSNFISCAPPVKLNHTSFVFLRFPSPSHFVLFCNSFDISFTVCNAIFPCKFAASSRCIGKIDVYFPHHSILSTLDFSNGPLLITKFKHNRIVSIPCVDSFRFRFHFFN